MHEFLLRSSAASIYFFQFRYDLDTIFTKYRDIDIDVDVDVVDLRAQADASMPASNNNVNYTICSNFYYYDVNCDFLFRELLLGNHKSYLAKIYQVVI